MPIEPLQDFGPAPRILGDKLACLLGQVLQDGAGFELRQRSTAVFGVVIDDGRDAVSGGNATRWGEKPSFRLELGWLELDQY